MIHCLPALFHSIPDQSHSSQLSGNGYPRDVGLKILIHVWKVHPPLLGPYTQ